MVANSNMKWKLEIGEDLHGGMIPSVLDLEDLRACSLVYLEIRKGMVCYCI